MRRIMLFLAGLQAVAAFSPSTRTNTVGSRCSPACAFASPATPPGNERLPAGWWRCSTKTPPAIGNIGRSRRRDDHRACSTRTTALTLTTTATGGGATTGAKEEVGDEASASPPAEMQKMEFVTPKMRVFIEDTDAYGVMYNANYLRAYDRALHMTYCCEGAGEVCNVDPVADTLEGAILRGKLGVLDHEGWSVVELTRQRFKSSPPLGGEFVVSGHLAGRSENRRSEVWEMQIRKPTADGLGEDGGDDRDLVYNSARVTIARPDLSPSCVPKPLPLEEAPASTSVTTECTFTPFRDEFDAHLPTHMPLRNVLNLFERARTSFIGGDLRRMQVEDNLIWVVTGVDRCALVNLGRSTMVNGDDEDEDDDYDVDVVECHPGRDVVVRTNFVPKRRGMMIECRHTLLVPELNQSGDDSSDGNASTGTKGRRIAQAIVTIMALNGKTRRPTTDIPPWLLEKIKGT